MCRLLGAGWDAVRLARARRHLQLIDARPAAGQAARREAKDEGNDQTVRRARTDLREDGVVRGDLAEVRAVPAVPARAVAMGLVVQAREVGAGARDQAEPGPGLQGHVEVVEKGRAGRQTFEDAALNMMLHQQNANLVDTAPDRHDLGEHLFAFAAGVEHPLKALDLAFNAPQPRLDVLADVFAAQMSTLPINLS